MTLDERELSPLELDARARDLADPVVVEALRVTAWRSLGASEQMVPAKGWPRPESRVDSTGQPAFITSQEQWRTELMTREQADELDKWDAPWRVRARAQDAAQITLDAKRKELDERERALTQGETRKAELAAPATAEEIELLDQRRVTAWVAKNLKRDSLDDLTGVGETDFATALRLVPVSGWPDGKDNAAHLLKLRAAEPEPYVEPEPETGGPGALSLLLGMVAK